MVGTFKGEVVAASISDKHWLVGSEDGHGAIELEKELSGNRKKKPKEEKRTERQQITLMKNILG